MNRTFIGIDVGSVSVNTILLTESRSDVPTRCAAGQGRSEQRKIVVDWYTRHKGQPLRTVLNLLKKIIADIPIDCITNLAVTGSGGKLVASLLGANFVNEIIAQARAVGWLYPDVNPVRGKASNGVKTVIEIGGEDSKLILLRYDEILETSVISDFSMNTICAAGTGSFLDQQASRLGLSIEEFGRFALRSKNPPRIAGRCSVFAKTDMIHLQQKATPDYDIVAGLCYAMARNFKSNIGRGKKFHRPIIFQGGVAANPGMVKAFESVLGLASGKLIVPKHYASMGAIGAVLINMEEENKVNLKEGMEQLQKHLSGVYKSIPRPFEKGRGIGRGFQPLQTPMSQTITPGVFQLKPSKTPNKIDAYLGIDVGSISTNLVIIDSQKNLLSKRYLMTRGKPIEAVRQGLEEIGKEVGEYVEIKGVCTTGSGRYLIGDFVGADIVKNEITAQAKAAAEIDKNVDTIFEIGGQDSKYISLENGAIVDFEMNKVCAAGTGSFLEEQAEKLQININEEFSRLALSAPCPVRLGERCTVFMESDLVHNQQRGANRDNLVAGLSYSIVYNYLNRVVGNKKVGDRIFFQGGVAANKGVVAAFEKVTGKRITVPPHYEVTGAIGCALIAMEENHRKKNRFKGFGLGKRRYKIISFECKGCPNRCEINKVIVEGEKPLFYGGRCEKYEIYSVPMSRQSRDRDGVNKSSPFQKGLDKGSYLPDLFAEREALMLNTYYTSPTNAISTKKIGIPRALIFYDIYPFWNTFFSELGFDVVLSDKTNKEMIQQGVEHIVAETCFPIKTAHGHILNLLEKGIDYIFLPSIINLPPHQKFWCGDVPQDGAKTKETFLCPYIQTLPYTAKSAIDIESSPCTQGLDSSRGKPRGVSIPSHNIPSETRERRGVKILQPIIYLREGKRGLQRSLAKIAKQLNKTLKEIERAISVAQRAQEKFQTTLRKRGEEVLSSLKDGQKALVIVSRPYNGCDSGINLAIPKKLREMGVLAIPMDYLPLEKVDIPPHQLSKNWCGGIFNQERNPVRKSRSAGFSNGVNMYWTFGQKILTAAEIIRREKNLYAVYLTNFGCGPDSFITRFFREKMGDKSYLQIEIDEHSADVGVITRCEAFLDSLKNTTQKEIVETKKIRRVSIPKGSKKIIYIPYISDHALAFQAAALANGIQVMVMPESDEETLVLGRKFTSGKECYPCIITTGDMVKITKRADFDPERASFFMPSGNGPCRFGQYHALHRLVLDELGYPQVPIYAPNQDEKFLKAFGGMGGNRFIRLAWQGIVAVDILEKALRETRPYEQNPGETERVYRDCLKKLSQAIIHGRNLVKVMKEARQMFEGIKLKKNGERPIIGIVGEIFVRCHRFSNNNIIKEIEKLGGEVWLPPASEWLLYGAYSLKYKSFHRKDYTDYIYYLVREKVQKHYDHRIAEPFKGYLKNYKEPPIEKTLNYSKPYLHPSFEGEAVLSIGKSIDFTKKGLCGIVNVMPFTCMPGTIVTAILKTVREDHNNIPCLTIAYDGLEHNKHNTRLEAFMYQTHEYKEHLKKVNH